MLTVDDQGQYSDGRSMDYLAFGSYKDLEVKASEEVTQKFMGKDFEALSGLYSFGGRWTDSELGMFVSAC